MQRCVDCIHYKACETWVKNWLGIASEFPYEAESKLCESFEVKRKCKMIPNFDDGYICNRCGTVFVTNFSIKKQNYCPKCGAEIIK